MTNIDTSDQLNKKSRGNYALYTSEQIRQAERLTCETGVKEIELIQKAGRGVAEFIANHFERRPVSILCGPGKNGSDGFVTASILEKAGWNVRVYCTKQVIMLNDIAAQAAKFWSGEVLMLSEIDITPEHIIVDALFGTGLNRELPTEIVETYNAVRQERAIVVAIDVPSGIRADLSVDKNTLKADYTVTMSRPRIEHVLQPGAQYCGKISVVDINIKPSAFAGMEVHAFLNHPELWRQFWKVPDAMTHKYIRGHVAVLGGETLVGASRLATSGAMRVGAGVASIFTSESAAPTYRSAIAPEVMVRCFDDAEAAADLMQERHVSVCLIGPGAEKRFDMTALAKACQALNIQVVLDGDALGEVPTELASIITPHEGELKRMFPDLADMTNKLEKAKKAAARAGCIVVLKGMDTIIAAPDGRAYINNKASPWLSTAGSGDVLAGAVAGCLAQKIPPFEAAASAVWLHGMASLKLGPALVASELPRAISSVLTEIYKVNP